MTAPAPFKYVSHQAPGARGPPVRQRAGDVRQRRDAAGHAACRGADLALCLRAHRQHRCGRGAWPCRAYTLVIGGHELAAATDPLLIGVDAPLVKRYPLAVGPRALCRRVGRRRRGREPRAGRGRAREGSRRLRAAAVRARRRGRLPAGQHAGASRARLQRAARPALRMGRRRRGLCRGAAHARPTASSGAAAPPCRSRPSAWWRAGTPGARCWTCGPRSRCPSSPTRSRAPCACR